MLAEYFEVVTVGFIEGREGVAVYIEYGTNGVIGDKGYHNFGA